MGKRGPKPRRAANPVWTPELAYACGLMASDGNLSSDGRHLNLTSNDIEQLETFKKCLGLATKISWKQSGRKGENRRGSQIQFGDVTLYRWFITIGITPQKTFTIGKISVPDRYFFDFLHGEFDGDGTSHAYWDTRWHSSVSIYISFACASVQHLTWLSNTLARLVGVYGLIRQYGKGVHYLRLAKTEAKVVFDAMYYSSDAPFLKRKKEKLDRQWAALDLSRLGKQPLGFKRGGSILKIA